MIFQMANNKPSLTHTHKTILRIDVYFSYRMSRNSKRGSLWVSSEDFT